MTKQSCPTCAHEKLPLTAEPCWTCSTGKRLNSQWVAKSAPADCDTCAHDDTPDTVSCDACGAVAAATGERWTLHIPKQAPNAPRASSRTIPITPAPIAQPAPVSQAGEASPGVVYTITPPDVFNLPRVTVHEAPSGEPLKVDASPADPSDPDRPIWPAMLATAAIAFCAGISFGLLVANLGAHQ